MHFRHVLCCYLISFFGICVTQLQAAEIKVDSTADPGPLRDAIIGAAPGDVVLLRAEGEVLLKSPLPVRRGIRIEGQSGPLAHILKVDGDFRHFDVSGLPVDETATIARLTLAGNLPDGDGGGISSTSNLRLESVQLLGNSAPNGGAIAQAGASLEVDRSYLAGNQSDLTDGAEGSGGAVFASGAEVTITSTGFANNTAGSGGAIAFEGSASTLNVRSSTLSGNLAVAAGGGVSMASGTGRFINLTLVGNISGSDTLSHIDAGTHSITVGNSLVVGEGEGLPGILGDLQAEGTGTNRAGTDLSLGLGMPAGEYGGLSPTYLLYPGSPAIDAGTNSLLPSDDRDQRGLARFSDGDGKGGDIVDQGAFEVQHYKVSALQIRGSATGGKDDGGYGNPFDPSDDADSISSADVFVQLTNTNKADIGDAVGANNAAGGGSVSFDERVWGGRVLLKGRELEVRRDLAIYGPGATRMFIDGNASSPVFRVGEDGQDVFAYMEGISIENGQAETGAGIVVQNGGRVSLKEVQISGNSASLAGGGIAVLSGATDIYRSALIDNQAGDQGGGVFGSGESMVIIDNSTLSGNSAGALGGAIASSGSLTVDSSTIVANGATGDTGLFVEGASGTVQNTILSLGGSDAIDAGSGTSLSSGGYNLSQAAESGFLTDASDIPATDPELDARALNGGETLSHAPKGTSPAIDAGSSYYPVVDGQLDQPGNDRVKGAGIDIGSVELQNDPPDVDCPLPASVECTSSTGASVQVIVEIDDLDETVGLTVEWKNGLLLLDSATVPASALPETLDRTFDFPIDASTLTITVTDSLQATTTCIVPVDVGDSQPPTVTLNGSATVTLECGVDSYTELSATATDLCDDNLTVTISESTLPGAEPYPKGTYTVTYSATDDSGNTGTATRTIEVVDTTAPSVSLNGEATLTLECGSFYADAGATVSDLCDGDIDPQVTDSNLPTDGILQTGTYTITYSATDSSNNTGTATRTIIVEDTTSPEVTLNGNDTITLESGLSIYNEEGATATDNCDTSVDVVIQSSLPDVSPIPLGSYTITYSATDAAGNEGTASRTIEVVDTTEPNVILNGSASLSLECGLAYTDAGASASDIYDGDLQVDVFETNLPASGSILTTGSYFITYSATDSSNNTGYGTRNITVSDTQPPVVTLNGDATVTVESALEVYAEAGATASDTCDGALPVTISSNIPDASPVPLGTYTVTYSATDNAGFITTATRTVVFEDTTPPVITLNLVGEVVDPTLECGVLFTDPGAVGSDAYDGTVTVTSSSDLPPEGTPLAAGTYIITYNAQDSSGNPAIPVIRTITVEDTIPPVITLNSDPDGFIDLTLEVGTEPYQEFGGIVSDGCDNSLSLSITDNFPDGDPLPVGTYTVTYSATDAASNTGYAYRTVTVVDTTAPEFLIEPADVEQLTDAGYCFATVEFAATARDNSGQDPTITYEILGNTFYPDGLTGVTSAHRFFPLEGTAGTEDAWLPQTVRYTATDASGNFTSDTFDVIVKDPFQNCAFNVAWPASLELGFAPEIDPNTGEPTKFVSSSKQQLLGLLDQSRWYKFTVTPGSRVTVILSGLPANYDMVVYRDIQSEFDRILDLFTNGTSEEKELSLLGAEFAPESFIPESFIAESFSPESFLPESFIPESFIPESFLPESFIPESFIPESFLPESFIPESFIADAYSPESFIPESFLPADFNPESFIPESFIPESFIPESFIPESFIGQDFTPESFIAAQLSSMIAFSAFPGVASEGVSINTYNTSGEYYVRVRGANGAFDGENPFTLSVFIEEEVCGPREGDEQNYPGVQGPESFQGSQPVGQSGNFETLIFWDSARTPGSTEDITTLDGWLSNFAGRPEVNGAVIDLAFQDRVVDANIQADDYPTCPYAKNLVAEEIKAIIDAWRVSTTVDGVSSLKYIMLLGNDDVIPFFRTDDEAFLANESNYVPPVRDENHSQSSLRYGQILTQDPYGADCEINLITGPYPYGGLAVGRLVESAADMIGQFERYDALSGGMLPVPDTALVTAYDFLDDLGSAIEFEFEQALGTQIDTLIDPSTTAPADGWTATELADIFLGSHHDIVFLAGHFSTGSCLAADYQTRLTAAQVRDSGADLLNTLIFSVGCHSGYNTVDSHAIDGITKQPDWAQAFAQMGATLIAGTGYQYGDTEFVEYSERLYLEMVRQLRTGAGAVSIGEALVNAKKKYLAETELMRGIHEKSLLQATLFGFPMLKVNVPGARITPIPEDSVVPSALPVVDANPGAVLLLSKHDLNLNFSQSPLVGPKTLQVFDPGSDPSTKADDTEYILKWYEGGNGIVSNPVEPVRPLDSYNVSLPGNLLRGVAFRGGIYEDENGFLPLTGAPTTEIRGVFGAFISEIFFPVQPFSTNYFGAICGGTDGERLNVFRTQFLNPDDGDPAGILRKYSQMNLRLYYNKNLETYYNTNGDAIIPALTAPPSISRVVSTADGQTVYFDITVLASPAVGVQEVWVTYTGIPGSDLHGAWVSEDLVQGGLPDTMVWSGSITLPAGVDSSEVRFIVQAASGIGLVTLKTNFGQYYQVGVDELADREETNITILDVSPVEPLEGYGYGETITVSAKLTRYDEGTQSDVGLVGERVGIRVGASRISGLTGAGGEITLDLPLKLRPSRELLQAYFTGDLLYSPSSAEQEILIDRQATVLEWDEEIPGPPAEIFGSDVIVSLRDALGTPLKERTVFFLVDYGNNFQIGNSVITDIAGRADLSEIFLPAGNATITAYYNGTIPLPDSDPVTITDLLYKSSVSDSLSVTFDQPIIEDSLGFDPQQVDVYYKSSGNGKNAVPLYENASIAGDVAFNVPLQPDDLLDALPNRDIITGHLTATLAGVVIADQPVTLDTKNKNYTHWTTTSQPGEAVSYIGIHWSDSPRFSTALSESPGPLIETLFIGNNFTEFRYVPMPGTDSYTTTFPNGGPTIVVKRGVVDPEASGLVEGEYGLDEDGGILFDVKFELEPGMTFLTVDSSNNNPFDPIEVEVIPEVNYLTEGGRMIIRLKAVPGMPEFPPASNADPNLFECRFILGADDGVQVRSIARVGEGLYAVPWTSEDPGHKQVR
ncbi:MAG: immunoglobulin-like domain-containing protein [Puniceicoccaceae bacterium]